MTLLANIQMALEALRVNRMRSALTMLGMLLGRRIDGNPRHRDILGPYALSQMRLGNGLTICGDTNKSSYGMGWYPSSLYGKTWWQHNGGMPGTQALLIVSDDGSQAFAYACNSINSNDWASASFCTTILGIMDGIDRANAWPAIDLFGVYNSEYDSWVATEFDRSLRCTELLEKRGIKLDLERLIDAGRRAALHEVMGHMSELAR